MNALMFQLLLEEERKTKRKRKEMRGRQKHSEHEKEDLRSESIPKKTENSNSLLCLKNVL